MKFLTAFFLLLLFFVFSSNAQNDDFQKDLYGIRLKQFREVPQVEFGKPAKSGKFEDGFEYEHFLLKPGASLYMVFEYSPEFKGSIWSIQISGTDSYANLGFHGLRFGLAKSEIEKKFGIPTKKVDVGEFGERWEFVGSNFSFEINKEGKLSSIKIKDELSAVDNEPKFEKVPKTEDVLKILTSGKNEELAKLLAPDMELYKGKETLFFKKSFENEIATDFSNVFGTIKTLAGDLKTITSKTPNEYEENGRFSFGASVKHVIKFKKGHKIREIVFKYEWGEFLIWEIKAD